MNTSPIWRGRRRKEREREGKGKRGRRKGTDMGGIYQAIGELIA